MKIVLIILGGLAALMLFGLLFPAAIAAGLAWLFFSMDMTAAGVVTIIVGLMAEIGYLIAVFNGSLGDGGSSGGSSRGSNLGWPGTLTALYVIDKMRDKE